MKNNDIPLDRLFKAARAARPAPDRGKIPEPMPAYLKARVLAHWRSGGAVDDLGLMLVGWFRRALVCGAIAMAISYAWSYGPLPQEPRNYEDIANYDFRAEEIP